MTATANEFIHFLNNHPLNSKRQRLWVCYLYLLRERQLLYKWLMYIELQRSLLENDYDYDVLLHDIATFKTSNEAEFPINGS